MQPVIHSGQIFLDLHDYVITFYDDVAWEKMAS
jgi:hypothetical protein